MKKNREKKYLGAPTPPEDEAICLFAGLLVNPDMVLIRGRNRIVRTYIEFYFFKQRKTSWILIGLTGIWDTKPVLTCTYDVMGSGGNFFLWLSKNWATAPPWRTDWIVIPVFSQCKGEWEGPELNIWIFCPEIETEPREQTFMLHTHVPRTPKPPCDNPTLLSINY